MCPCGCARLLLKDSERENPLGSSSRPQQISLVLVMISLSSVPFGPIDSCDQHETSTLSLCLSITVSMTDLYVYFKVLHFNHSYEGKSVLSYLEGVTTTKSSSLCAQSKYERVKERKRANERRKADKSF